MLVNLVLISLFSVVFGEKSCYFNKKCPYDLFASKTPYDSIRGDVRDTRIPNPGCKVMRLWTLHRHGNRNPTADVTEDIKILQDKIKRETIDESTNCLQDIEDLTTWTWNSTLESSPAFLTGVGYDELFGIGKRISRKYFRSDVGEFLFRATNEQRTVTSAMAYVHGLTEGSETRSFTLTVDDAAERDDVIRPYQNCYRYQKEVKNGELLAAELNAYDTSIEFLAVKNRVQTKMNINFELTSADVYNIYELCRFERSWSHTLRSPWCSFFSDQDLVVLEYRDDVRHYYRNGYGSPINSKLGSLTLKDLYVNFLNGTEDDSWSVVSYFTHDTMMEMVFSALGLYRDAEPLRGAARNASRLWRTSEIAAFATNFIAVLYRCEEYGEPTHRVQLFINEKPTTLCPEEGCTWQQFLDIFQPFSSANLDFCTYDESNSGSYPSQSLLTGSSYNSINHRMVIGTVALIAILTIIR